MSILNVGPYRCSLILGRGRCDGIQGGIRSDKGRHGSGKGEDREDNYVGLQYCFMLLCYDRGS